MVQLVSNRSTGVIELIGLPGSGKTWVYEQAEGLDVHTASSQTDGQGDSPAVGAMGRIRLLASSPVLGIVAYLTVATRRRATRSNLLRVFQISKSHRRNKRLASTSTLVDEGAIHALFISLYGTRRTWISNRLLLILVRRLSKPVGCYLLLDVPPASCVVQFSNRDVGSTRFHSKSTQKEIHEFTIDSAYSDIQRAIESVAGEKLRSVRNSIEALRALEAIHFEDSHGRDA